MAWLSKAAAGKQLGKSIEAIHRLVKTLNADAARGLGPTVININGYLDMHSLRAAIEARNIRRAKARLEAKRPNVASEVR